MESQIKIHIDRGLYKDASQNNALLFFHISQNTALLFFHKKIFSSKYIHKVDFQHILLKS